MVAMKWRFRLISCVILVILCLQAFAVIFRTHAKGWPFIDYPMYSKSLEEGDRIEIDRQLYVTLADSSEVLVGPDSIGLENWWIFRSWIILSLDPEYEPPHPASKHTVWLRELTTGEQGLAPSLSYSNRKSETAAVSWLVDLYRQRHEKEIVALRLEDEGVLVTRDGMKTVPKRVLWTRTLADSSNGDY
jgi:hypothetical protein